MGNAYTVYWPRERWERAATVAGDLPVLFGGPHQSLPSFVRAKVGPGDRLYPIGFRDRALWLLGRVRVTLVEPVPPSSPYPDGYGPWRFLAASGTAEVVHCADSVRRPQGVRVPGEALQRLTYQPLRGAPRPVTFVTEDGRLTRADSVQGIYRLTAESAADLDALLAGAPAGPGADRAAGSTGPGAHRG